MTLWSSEKMYLRQKDVGAAWTPACGISSGRATVLTTCLPGCRRAPRRGRLGRRTRGCAALLRRAGLLGRCSRGLLRQPFLKIFGRVDRDEALHPVVPQPAQLGAGDLPIPDAIALEPDPGLHPRHEILLDPELRQEEGVDHVLGGQGHDHRLSDREVELVERHDVVGRVELAVGAGVADVPGELLALDVDLQRVLGHVLLDVLPEPSREQGEDDADQRRDDRPDDLQAIVAVRVVRLAALAVAVLEEEEQQDRLDQDEDDPRDPHDQVEHVVHRLGVGRDLLRQPQPERQRRGEDAGASAAPKRKSADRSDRTARERTRGVFTTA